MEQGVEQCGDGGGVTEELPPVVDRTIRGEHGGGPFVAAHDQLEQVLGGGMRQLAQGAFPISRSRAHTHRRHGHPLQTVPSAGLIERPQEKNRVDALR